MTVWLNILLSFTALQAQVDVEDLPPVSGTYALTNVTVHTQPGQAIEGATVVITDGLITAVGTNVTVPGEALVLDADSMHVYAGFIDGMSQLGQEKPERDRRERPDDPGNPPKEMAGIQPQRYVLDLLDGSSSDFEKLRSTGFTASHVVPIGGMMPGQGALISLAGQSPDEMRLKGPVSMFMQLEGARGRIYPSNLLGVMATFKQMYRQAELSRTHEQQYEENPAGMARPTYDQETRALYPMVNQEVPAMFLAEDRMDVFRILALQKELGFKLMMAGLTDGAYQIEALKGAGVPVFLSLELPDKPEEAEVDSTLSEAEQDEAAALTKRRQEAYEMAIMQAAKLQEAGIAFGFTTYDVSEKDIPANLRRLVSEGGLTEDQALAALTTSPAKLLGLSNMLGTVETGKVAHLLVSDAPYFSEDAKIRYVIVDGEVFEQEAKRKRSSSAAEAVDVAGTWEYTLESPQGKTGGTIIFTGETGSYEGTISTEMVDQETELDDIFVDGSSLSFTYSVDAGGQSLQIEVSVDIEGETFEGTVSVGQYGSFPIEGERTAKPE